MNLIDLLIHTKIENNLKRSTAMKTKTKKDIIEILLSGKHNLCEPEVDKALKFLEKFEDNDTIDKIASYAPERWAYYWALDIGDREIIRDRITEPEWAYRWALWDKVTESEMDIFGDCRKRKNMEILDNK